ncbi:MAG: HesA/MoeB/ThiF family protein [Oscillospiraceae bacterium]|nr:HesA/MoeB/ThiF family protein [Oscillospiraceae bacterium]
MEQRFKRNIPTISEEEQALLRTKRAVIIGCGGLGGYIAEFLARAGVGGLTLVDGDVFEESNLNRQTLALECNIGMSKAKAAAERVKTIDSAIDVRFAEEFFTAENAAEILKDADIVMDALDNIPARLLLEDECAARGLILVHGAVQGWAAQVCVSEAGSGVLHRIYGSSTGGHADKSVLSPVPPFCAAMQCAEALKKLCGRKSEAEGKLIAADMRSMDIVCIEL